MTSAIISIPASDLQKFSESAQKELLAYITSCFPGLAGSASEETGLEAVALNVAQARAYLNNCSDATIEILEEIVARDGDFFMSDLSGVTGKSSLQLRGALGGITKRARTICGDPNACLIEWLKTGDKDWHGRVSPTTVASLRVVLEERQ